MFNFDLSQDIECYLLTQASCSEYDIIRHLQSIKRLSPSVLNTSLSMFRCHFLVFNALHRININWLSDSNSNKSLEITSLRIWVHSHETDTQNKQEPHSQEAKKIDPLSVFYLDLKQLNQTTETDIHKLLDQFWLRFTTGNVISEEKQQALKTLEIEEDVDFSIIKKQYRRLAMRHHPDRGGDEKKLIAINKAMECLESFY